MPESESDFHWVIARNTCSVDRIFEKLRLDVKSDVEMRQKLRDPLPPPENGFHYGFSFSSNGSKFSASLKGRSLNHAIIFALTENYIIVSDENDKELFKASVTLSNDGQCRLVVGAVELEGWQFRKKALEKLFFSTAQAPDWFAKFGGHQS
ncbi:MAG: hypothetical protein WAJ99_04500 [Candidatus Sulfotelmatobacter sp.]